MVTTADDLGWLPGYHHAPSPNHDARPDGTSVILLVVHSISLPPGHYGGGAVERFFLNHLDTAEHPYFQSIATLRVSAHFFVTRDGVVTQFVSCSDRAWHAGISCWRGRRRCNDFSIGIELEGGENEPFTEVQYAALARLARDLTARYPIEEIVGHADIAPGRKTDPGPHFDWGKLRALFAVA